MLESRLAPTDEDHIAESDPAPVPDAKGLNGLGSILEQEGTTCRLSQTDDDQGIDSCACTYTNTRCYSHNILFAFPCRRPVLEGR